MLKFEFLILSIPAEQKVVKSLYYFEHSFKKIYIQFTKKTPAGHQNEHRSVSPTPRATRTTTMRISNQTNSEALALEQLLFGFRLLTTNWFLLHEELWSLPAEELSEDTTPVLLIKSGNFLGVLNCRWWVLCPWLRILIACCRSTCWRRRLAAARRRISSTWKYNIMIVSIHSNLESTLSKPPWKGIY